MPKSNKIHPVAKADRFSFVDFDKTAIMPRIVRLKGKTWR